MSNRRWSIGSSRFPVTTKAVEQQLTGFIRELQSSKYAPLTVLGYANSAAHFAVWATQKQLTVQQMNQRVVTAFARHRCRCSGGGFHGKRVSHKYVARVRRFITYLERQHIIEPIKSQDKIILKEFRDWLITHRCVCASTAQRYEYAVLSMLSVKQLRQEQFTAATVRSLVLKQANRCSAGSLQSKVTALRAYLRFLAFEGCCTPGLDNAVPCKPNWRLSSLPRYLPPTQLQQVIQSCNRNTAMGQRDHAILLLLGRLGLRAGDIVNMRLVDIDWQKGTVNVSGKNYQHQCLPLPQDAGNALLVYLQHARPKASVEHVFLRSIAPYRPFASSSAVSAIVNSALRRANIVEPPSRGAHLLRHSAATAMLRDGCTLDTVCHVLRHRSIDMTAHYAKIDIALLEQVVQPWPKGASC